MAIYKSSFNQPNKKPEKPKKEKPEKKEKLVKEKQTKPQTKIKVKKSVVCLILFAIIFVSCCLPSNFLKNFLLGVFGLLVYPVSLLGVFFSIGFARNKKYNINKKYMAYITAAMCVVWFILHLILTSKIPLTTYGQFLMDSYRAKTAAGGLIYSLISYPLVKLLTYVGAYVFSGIALAILVGLIIDYVKVGKYIGKAEKKTKFNLNNLEEFSYEEKIIEPQISPEEQVKKNAKKKLGLEKGETTVISSTMPTYKVKAAADINKMNKRDYILTPIDPIIPIAQSDDKVDRKPNPNAFVKINKNQVRNFGDNISEKFLKPEEPKVQPQNSSVVEIKQEKVEYVEPKVQQSASYIESVVTPIEPVVTKIEPVLTPIEPAVEPVVETLKYDDYKNDNDIFVSNNSFNNYETKFETDATKFEEQEDDFDLGSDYDFSDEQEEDFEQDYNTDNDYYEEDNNDDIIESLEKELFSDDADEYSELEQSEEDDYVDVNLDEDDYVDDFTTQSEPVKQPEIKQPAQVNNEYATDEYATQMDNSYLGSTVDTTVVRPSVDLSKFNLPNTIKKPVGEQEKPKNDDRPEKLNIPPYVAPPAELLDYLENPVRISDEELQDNIDRLEQVLEDFRVPAKVNNVQVGPAVTRYELTMPRGISVNKIAQMADDIAMTLASNGSIRVEAPIPGKTSVGIEVPNNQVSGVSLRELIESEEFKARGNPLSFVLGKDINGDIIFCNLDKMPHVLVAGSTGSGKSVCLNTMLLSMCYKAGPQDLRLILVDPKMVEFSTYNGLPHLLIPEVIIGKDLTINALDWSIKEMERRYALFAKNKVVNINEFNKLDMVKSGKEEKLPFIVIVVDELADLMLEAKREIEDRIAKLAAKARAAGIHLVLATQRPSVDVITGTVKANLPSRIAFALTNYMDSKTVLDGGGAEKLLGKGDMLFKPQDKPEPRRIQGAYVSNPEIARVVQYIKDYNNPVYDERAGRAIKNPNADKVSQDGSYERDVEFDPVLKDALRMFIQVKQASASMIQRRYSVGSSRAGRIIDQMEIAGFVGPMDGAKPRQVLITMEEFKAIFGED